MWVVPIFFKIPALMNMLLRVALPSYSELKFE